MNKRNIRNIRRDTEQGTEKSRLIIKHETSFLVMMEKGKRQPFNWDEVRLVQISFRDELYDSVKLKNKGTVVEKIEFLFRPIG